MMTNLKKDMQTSSHMVNGSTAYMINLKDLKIPNQRVPEYTKEERAENAESLRIHI